jgi:sugar phosphate isomerase/epimerase
MPPCISQATTLSTPFECELSSYARLGWTAVEIWLSKLETYLEDHTTSEARSVFEEQKIEPAAAAIQGGPLLSRGAEREVHRALFRRRLAILQELIVPVLIVAADFNREPVAEDCVRAADLLADAADTARGFGVRIALKFQKSARYCASLDTTLALIAQSWAPVGVCFDVFRYFTGPSKFEDLAYLSPETFTWVQLCDLAGTSRELALDGDRVLPGEGDCQIEPILDQMARIGYDGYVSLELLNAQLWRIAADRVTSPGYQALCRALGRWNTSEPRGASGGGGP